MPESALASPAAFEATTHAVLALAYAVVAIVLLAATRGRLGAPATAPR